MPKSLSGIYGADDNGMASKISSAVLRDTSGPADMLDQTSMSRGTSKGTVPDTNEVVIIHPNKGDSRATTKGNHGSQG
jgi:hypothetical protein